MTVSEYLSKRYLRVCIADKEQHLPSTGLRQACPRPTFLDAFDYLIRSSTGIYLSLEIHISQDLPRFVRQQAMRHRKKLSFSKRYAE